MSSTPAKQFKGHLNALTRDLGDIGLYWRGDLAQFWHDGSALVHVCGARIRPETINERRLDLLAQMATTHLLSCELRQAQAPMPRIRERPGPETSA